MMIEARMLPSDQVVLDVVDGRFDEDGLIRDDLQCCTSLGSVAWIACEALLHVLRRRDRVLAGLFGDDQRDGRHAIEPRGGLRLLVAVFGIADIADLDDVAVAIDDRDLIELRRRR